MLMALVVVAVVALGTLAQRPRPERIALENFRRLRTGMSRAEVLAIIGPPGDYFTGEPDMSSGILFDIDGAADLSPQQMYPDGSTTENWECDTAGITVVFSRSGLVTCGWFLDINARYRGIWGKIRWRVQNEWQEWVPHD
jgi:hypothetical protein